MTPAEVQAAAEAAVRKVLNEPLVRRWDYQAGTIAEDRESPLTMLHYVHKNGVEHYRGTATPAELAAAIVAALPDSSLDVATVEAAVRNVLRAGVDA